MDATRETNGSWCAEQFSGADFGDQRWTKRLVHTAERILRQPGGSFPDKFKDPADLDGFYRLLASSKVTHAAVLAPHIARTLEQMRQQPGVVLVLHDTTVLDYSGLHKTEGLGQVGDGNGRGYYCHNSLAVTPDRKVLGLVHQILHRRRTVPKGETKAQCRDRPDRESRLWKAAVAAIPPPPPGQLRVNLADRGADILEFLDYMEATGQSFVVRSQHNRRVEIRENGAVLRRKLHDHLRTREPGDTFGLAVPAKAGRTARTATMALAWTALEILPPRQPRGDERGTPLRVWAVRAWEPNLPSGAEPLEWMLLTNRPVTDAADARATVEWYCVRWVLEEFHKGQKTGCAIEQMQFRSVERLQPAIALLSVITVRLLQLRDASRDPVLRDQPATRWMPPLWVEVLSAWRHDEARVDWTLGEFYYALARLGGHQNRKHDHPPGWLVLWRGWTQLQAMTTGAAIRQAKRCGET